MKIVFAIDHLGPGGAQRQAVELAIALTRRLGAETQLVTYHEQDHYRGRLDEAGVTLTRLPRRGRLDAGYVWRLGRHFRECGADVVHAFMPGPALWAGLALRTLRRPRPVFVAGERTGRLASERAKALAEHLAYRMADAVTANAEPMLDALRDLGVPRERLHYLPNGIDVEAWDRGMSEPCPIPLEPGCTHLALVGSLHPQKNHETLIDALAQLSPDARRGLRVLFVGAPTAGAAFAEGLRERARDRGVADLVSFHAPVKQVPALMAHLDGLVMPSRWEGFPNVLLEAMTSGLPAVVTPVGDVGSIAVDGETAWVLRHAEDARGLAALLERLLAMGPEARARMGQAARARALARYRVEVVAARHLELYERLLAARASARRPGPEPG